MAENKLQIISQNLKILGRLRDGVSLDASGAYVITPLLHYAAWRCIQCGPELDPIRRAVRRLIYKGVVFWES
jgi:hypothetical protein